MLNICVALRAVTENMADIIPRKSCGMLYRTDMYHQRALITRETLQQMATTGTITGMAV